MKKKNYCLLSLLMFSSVNMLVCPASVQAKDESVYIVYTNDVHSYIYNTEKDENENEIPALRFSKVAAMVSDMRLEGKEVLLVDAGDELQGDVYGAFDQGESVIQLMNASGYQLATPGNHDFDYGSFELFNRMEEAEYPYISCNFHDIENNIDPLADHCIFEIGGKKIAFIGIMTPETITTSTPTYFQNEKGEYIYAIDGTETPEDLYVSVQKAVDDVRDQADYVIALAHLGVGITSVKSGVSSYDVIAHVTGVDAYIDGHSHTTMEKEIVSDRDGKAVILTQTGSYLNSVGVMEISEDGIDTKLVKDYENENEAISEMEDSIHERLMEQMGEKVAELEQPMYINNPEKPEQRLIRACEMNAGDIVADSVYWYLNDVAEMNCDVAIINGGGVRAQVEKGDITMMDIKSIEPFGNMACLIEATGQQILDALEMGASVVGVWDDEWDAPAENGCFMHVAGLRYTIDSTIPSFVKTSGDGMFVSVDGNYRVKDVQIYNKESEEYEPMDVNKTYTLGGMNYILRNGGNGLTMFNDNKMLIDYIGQDFVLLSEYLKHFKSDGEYPVINTENSPLHLWKGYLIDYENPYGSGRINMILE